MSGCQKNMETRATKFMPKEISDYIFVDDPANDKVYALQLTSGEYANTRYKYGNVKFVEDHERDTCKLSFAYKIIYKPNNLDNIDLDHDIQFKNHIGDVLTDILENQEYKIGSHGE